MKLYKCLTADHEGPFSKFYYEPKYLPKKRKNGTWKPGQWLPKFKSIQMCCKGYHAFQGESYLVCWGEDLLFEVENHKNSKISTGNAGKIVMQQMRFVRPMTGYSVDTYNKVIRKTNWKYGRTVKTLSMQPFNCHETFCSPAFLRTFWKLIHAAGE